MSTRIPFLLDSFEDMKAHIENEIRETIAYHYEACLILHDRIWTLKFMGHERPFERLGEIIFEFEIMLEYMIPEEYRPARSIYQDIIDEAMAYLKKQASAPFFGPSFLSYPYFDSFKEPWKALI
jgi:hypothetical protein